MNQEYKNNKLYKTEERLENFVEKYAGILWIVLLTAAYTIAYIQHFK